MVGMAHDGDVCRHGWSVCVVMSAEPAATARYDAERGCPVGYPSRALSRVGGRVAGWHELVFTRKTLVIWRSG